ncbi:hypothetical protein GH714_009954 [Hevea brasiliensis]|uniref:DUF3730 domain-containing protein n=1 Tax=Hevea brasiliensis TaxID=3981 RepID=A0A6A6M958_HEVBR|nr:hypothetical protein GH714_009954 [Hevea brasiliensis]
MTSQLSQTSYDILEGLSAYFPSGIGDLEPNMTSELFLEKRDDLEEDIWGVAGLVLGLGSSVGAIYRAGAHDVVLKIKDLILSWTPHLDTLVINSGLSGEGADKVLSVGSCLAIPVVVALCRRVELMNENELDHLVNGYTELISELLSVKKSGTIHQSLLMASCVGAGSLLACILNEAVHPIKVEHIKGLLEFFRKCYSNPYHALVHMGGMLGVVNAMGANAGFLFPGYHSSSSVRTGYQQKESSYVLGPLLSSPICESHLTALIQEIFLVAQNSDDLQMKQIAAWAVSFLRNLLWSKELLDVDNSVQTDVANSKTVSRSFSEDSLVMKLSLWLMHLNYSAVGIIPHVGTVSTVLRCLSGAPRLPTMDWGSIIRCMRYEAQVSELLPPDSALEKGSLRKDALQFSIAHANQFDPLLTFLDELSDLSRFRTLELNLQSYYSPKMYNSDQKRSLRISFWRGLCQCLDEDSLRTPEYMPNVEKCMEVLFSLLPASEAHMLNPAQEWYEVVKCLAKARGDWLLDFLQVPPVNLVQGDEQFNEVLKKIVAKAKLVRIGSITLTELGRLKAYILNSRSHGIWNVLVEVVAALQYAEGSVKRHWLVDAVEISCVSSYPSTALQFLGLLSGSCCKYMPLLTLDRLTVLSDLPVTLHSLLTEPSWEVVAESIVSHLLVSTERIYHWVTDMALDDGAPNVQPIDESENDMVAFLLPVMHQVCLSLKDYLPLEKQLRLANIVVK